MWFKKKPDKRPLGVPLDQLQLGLGATTLKCKRVDDSLVVTHEHFSTTVRVVPPDAYESNTGPIQAVVQVSTALPSEIAAHFQGPIGLVNRFAATGALTADGVRRFVGARLTIYEGECGADNLDVWDLHAQLLLVAITASTDAVLGGMRVGMGMEAAKTSPSLWGQRDFEQVKSQLSKFCVCGTEGDALTAEIGLVGGAVHSTLGHATALWQVEADTHPYLGGGLSCRLSLPHRVPNSEKLELILLALNKAEMAARDLAPHFGAWTMGPTEDNPVYCSFLPNVLHANVGVAMNMSVWAIARARWAHGVLASIGISL
jgi:hypothetical protein